MRNRIKRTRLGGEPLESRTLLTSIGFVEQPIDRFNVTPGQSGTMADLDGDGDLDVIGRLGHLRRDIAWREHLDGKGTFGPDRIVSTQTKLVDQIIAADIDGDGDIDIIASGGEDLEIAWYENRNGKGRFGPKQFIDISARSIRSLSAADLDGDGDLDLFQMIERQRLVWYENTDGQGQFRTRNSYQTPHDTGSERDAVAFDFDSDGDLDIIMPGYWMENNGNAEFTAPMRFIDGEFLTHVFHLDDFDNNGQLDIVLAQSVTTVAWYEANARTGEFELRQTVHTPSDGSGFIYDFDAADIDGDGDLELVIDERLGADLYPYTWVYDLPTGELLHDMREFQFFETTGVYDVNGDGADDLVLRGLWHSFATGERRGFGSEVLENWHSLEQIELADLDGDRDLDIVSFGLGGTDCQDPPCGYLLTWKENLDGLGTYGQRRLIKFWSVDQPFTIVDFIPDGKPEILIGSELYSFVEGQVAFIGEVPDARQIVSIDWDGDGDLDALSVKDDSLYWYENELPSSPFLGPVLLVDSGFRNLDEISAHDIDSDGDLDILAVRNTDEVFIQEDNPVVWFENIDGLSTKPKVLIESSFPHVDELKTLPGDYDGDGDLDLMLMFSSSLNASRNTFLVTNNGDNFDDLVNVNIRPSENPFVADIDRDGDLDLIPYATANKLDYWFENIDNTFIRNRIDIQNYFAFGDVDGDGDADYVGRNVGFSWYENRPLGDANGDGKFNSADLVVVMQAAKYEDGVPNNATFEDGDWNGDGDFDSADLVAAMQAGHYTLDARLGRDTIAAAFADAEFAFERALVTKLRLRNAYPRSSASQNR